MVIDRIRTIVAKPLKPMVLLMIFLMNQDIR
jgi:hypothetical protein